MAMGLVSQAKRSQRVVDASYPCAFESVLGGTDERLWLIRPESTPRHIPETSSRLRTLLT